MPSRTRSDFVTIQRSMMQDVGYALGTGPGWLFLCLLIEADHRTGVVTGDGERQLAQRFGMSRGAYRSYIERLEHRGVVRVAKPKNQYDAGSIELLWYAAFTGRDVARRPAAGTPPAPDVDQQPAMTSDDNPPAQGTRRQDFGLFDQSVHSVPFVPQETHDEVARRNEGRPQMHDAERIDDVEEWRIKRERARSLRTRRVERT